MCRMRLFIRNLSYKMGGNIAPFCTGVSLIGRAIILSSVSIYYFTKLNILFEIVAIFEPKIERKMSFLPNMVGVSGAAEVSKL